MPVFNSKVKIQKSKKELTSGYLAVVLKQKAKKLNLLTF